MQTLYGIHVNNVNQVSVDIFSEKHKGVAKWRIYFCVTPSSVLRLRRVYQSYRKRCIVTREWSPGRWKAYKEWCTAWVPGRLPNGGGPSLDHLATSGPYDKTPA